MASYEVQLMVPSAQLSPSCRASLCRCHHLPVRRANLPGETSAGKNVKYFHTILKIARNSIMSGSVAPKYALPFPFFWCKKDMKSRWVGAHQLGRWEGGVRILQGGPRGEQQWMQKVPSPLCIWCPGGTPPSPRPHPHLKEANRSDGAAGVPFSINGFV